MIKHLIRISLVAIGCLLGLNTFAQNKVLHYHDWEIYLRGGLTTYTGEVKGGGIKDYDDSKFVFAGGLAKSFGPNFQVAADFFTGKTSGSLDNTLIPSSFTNNIYFQADIFGMSLIPKANLSRIFLGKNYRFRVPDFWVGAGIGMLGYRTIRRSGIDDTWQASVGYYLEGSREGPMAPSVMIPLGAEAKFKITKTLVVGVSYYTYLGGPDKLDTILDGGPDTFSQISAGLYIQLKEKKVRTNGTLPRQKGRRIGTSPSTRKKKLNHPLMKFKNTN